MLCFYLKYNHIRPETNRYWRYLGAISGDLRAELFTKFDTVNCV
ncbi:hypothetical protein HMPREF0388_0114 [Mobiluncus curtisii ATCC 51333]|uniref:Uncharacterized protein n=1 Tax=Mobiluncus curtisii ATCC 51333 TaxID=887326 RepID=E6LW77_9ACTO|nr:hypothetical protein HMPREF0388_0114 [Mobiluncus curtisii ATCC 51333]